MLPSHAFRDFPLTTTRVKITNSSCSSDDMSTCLQDMIAFRFLLKCSVLSVVEKLSRYSNRFVWASSGVSFHYPSAKQWLVKSNSTWKQHNIITGCVTWLYGSEVLNSHHWAQSQINVQRRRDFSWRTLYKSSNAQNANPQTNVRCCRKMIINQITMVPLYNGTFINLTDIVFKY